MKPPDGAASEQPLPAQHDLPSARTSSPTSSSQLLAPTTATDFAGLLFFLNLDLYDDDSELDRWELLAYLGRALAPELEDDPLWPVLGELAERPLDREPDSVALPDPLPLLCKRLPVDDPIAFLLRRFGRIALTPAHVDVFFSLAAHPIEIRLSGLDRDPGWLLPAGRHVAFHFD
jgi:hypothetical protein